MNQTVITPKLYIWSNQLLFLGALYIPHKEHRVVSDKLFVSIEGKINIKVGPQKTISTRSCLVKAGKPALLEHIDPGCSTMAIYYLGPLTQDYPALAAQMTKVIDGLHYQHPDEDTLIETLLSFRNAREAASPGHVYRELRPLIIPPHLEGVMLAEFDPRVAETVYNVRQSVRENHPIRFFADQVHLSASRLEKLFKEQMGIPIIQYRSRYRVFISIIYLAMGKTVTEAAIAAGFASPAHFTNSFSAINGVPPSEAFMKPPIMETLVADDALELVASRLAPPTT